MVDENLNEKVAELEKMLEMVEKKLKLHDDYIKMNTKDDIMDEDKFKKLQEEINFIDEKLEHMK